MSEKKGIEKVDEFFNLDDKSTNYRRLVGVIAIAIGLWTLVVLRKKQQNSQSK